MWAVRVSAASVAISLKNCYSFNNKHIILKIHWKYPQKGLWKTAHCYFKLHDKKVSAFNLRLFKGFHQYTLASRVLATEKIYFVIRGLLVYKKNKTKQVANFQENHKKSLKYMWGSLLLEPLQATTPQLYLTVNFNE